MTQEEILEGNKLIAEFMGSKLIKNKYTGNLFSNLIVYGINSNVLFHENKLQYNSSWDWLMPIVEKIQHMDNKFEVNIDFQIHLMGAVELHINHKRVFGMTAFEPGTLINAVYEGVVEFIKWYNKQKT